jgi:hypothetical protein
MARIATDPNYNSPTFPRATAGSDIFVKEDVQALAAAMSTHTHNGAGTGLAVAALAPGSVTSAAIVDGTITAADMADATVTNAKLGPDVARANLLTNGGFEIWQRGNGPFAGGSYSADRWGAGISGTDTLNVSRDTTNMDIRSVCCAVATFTKGTGSGTSLGQDLKEQVNQLRGQTVTCSMRVKTSTANAVRLRITDGISATANSSYHTGGGAYETLRATFTVSASATTFTLGAQLDATCTAYLDNAMVVMGTQAADYVPTPVADDLARCLRYYEASLAADGVELFAGTPGAGLMFFNRVAFKVQKAVTPTVTKSGTWTASNSGQPTVAAFSTTGWLISATAVAAGYAFVQANAAGNSWTAEANP